MYKIYGDLLDYKILNRFIIKTGIIVRLNILF